jgi:hypothetical protein
MHLRRFHDMFDPLTSRPLSDEERHRMAVMFFRQGNNFINRYVDQRVRGNDGLLVTPGGGAAGSPADYLQQPQPQKVPVTDGYVRGPMLDGHQVPPELQGRTTPNIPRQGDDSFVERYPAKIGQLKQLLEQHARSTQETGG